MSDPITIITAISAGLSLIDKFRTLSLKILNKPEKPPSVNAQKKGDVLEISYNGQVTDHIDASRIRLNEWDDLRYTTLTKKVMQIWRQYNGLDLELASVSADEKQRLMVRMDNMREDLCRDFRELLAIYEKTLGVPLGDHYSLYSVCGINCPT